MSMSQLRSQVSPASVVPMVMAEPDVRVPRQALERVLERWPHDDGTAVDLKAIAEALGDSAPGDWGLQSLGRYAVRPRGSFEVLDGVVCGEAVATFLVIDTASAPVSPELYLAILRQRPGRAAGMRWQLDSLQANCPSCLGTGLVSGDSKICRTCGGGGWGVGDEPQVPAKFRASRLAAAATAG